jgi:hypothetical protein
MNTLQSIVGRVWDAPLELLPFDLLRGFVLAAATLAALGLLAHFHLRRRLTIWGMALLIGLALAATSVLLRPASTGAIASASLCGALLIAALVVRGGRWTWARLGTTALAVMVVAGSVSFQLWWMQAASQRAIVLQEMRHRPDGPWPRGDGHVTLAGYGAIGTDRGWLESGGSFSPAFKSPGLSIWVIGPDGQRLTSSDEIPRSETRQAYGRTDKGQMRITTTTPYYQLSVEVAGPQSYRFHLDRISAGGLRLAVLLRSVGPAGSPLETITATEDGLLANQTWRLNFATQDAPVCLGDELNSGGLTACLSGTGVRSNAGWAFARLDIDGDSFAFSLERGDEGSTSEPLAPFPAPGLSLDGFPPTFTGRLAAQIDTLLGTTIEAETRPGDPVNYINSWQRDGAYIVVALGRAGLHEQARRLVTELAENDFYGGFGSEADAPGLALWALGEVATALRNPTFDEWAMPHVTRKVDLVKQMLALTEPWRQPFFGPLVPRTADRDDTNLVALPSEDGLIVGRMDWHYPRYYVNAVTYLGLREAATIAGRLEEVGLATAWTILANDLRDAYRNSFASAPPDDEQALNPRTAISGLWPTGIADPDKFAPILEAVWQRDFDPQGQRPRWSYFTFAQAHQWLRLGEIGRVHTFLDWADQQDIVPGLQVFWEGDGEENSSGLWLQARGHLQPDAVTPHYWTSAEAVLLSLEMLAYINDQDELVLGGGLLPEWLKSPLSAQEIGTRRGTVSWTWDGVSCLVVDTPALLLARAGPSFPTNTTVIREGEQACPAPLTLSGANDAP